MIEPKVPIAKEGYPFIGLAAFATLLFAVLCLSFLTCILFATTIFIIYFFRDPERFTPNVDDSIICPADGKVIIVEKVESNDFIENEQGMYKVCIFMNVFNVHVNRIPINGVVDKIIYKPGKFYSADSSKGGMYNEHCATIITTQSNNQIVFVQIAGLIARRIINWLEPGDEVKRGSRFGLIRFGSRVDMYLPVTADITVQVGDKVKAGETVIAKLG